MRCPSDNPAASRARSLSLSPARILPRAPSLASARHRIDLPASQLRVLSPAPTAPTTPSRHAGPGRERQTQLRHKAKARARRVPASQRAPHADAEVRRRFGVAVACRAGREAVIPGARPGDRCCGRVRWSVGSVSRLSRARRRGSYSRLVLELRERTPGSPVGWIVSGDGAFSGASKGWFLFLPR